MAAGIIAYGAGVPLPGTSSGGGSLAVLLALAAGLSFLLLLPGAVMSLLDRHRTAKAAPRPPDFESLLRQLEAEVERSLRDPVLVNQARRRLRSRGPA